MKCLSKGSAQYAVDNEDMLDQFWVVGKRVKFSEDWVGIDRYKLVEGLYTTGFDSVFPLPET